MVKFHQKCNLVRLAIEDVLENDEALIGLYLTESTYDICRVVSFSTLGLTVGRQGIQRDLSNHDEAELLLETYYNQCNEIVQQAERVISNVKNTEEIINIMLDANRNSLMLTELKVTIGTLGFTIGMFFTALYGMNLLNFIEESDYGLGAVTGVASIIAAGITWYNFRKLTSIRKVSMTGLAPKVPLSNGHRYRVPMAAIQQTGSPGPLGSMLMRRRQNMGPSNRALMWKWLVEKRTP
jgi:magnesium transporter